MKKLVINEVINKNQDNYKIMVFEIPEKGYLEVWIMEETLSCVDKVNNEKHSWIPVRQFFVNPKNLKLKVDYEINLLAS